MVPSLIDAWGYDREFCFEYGKEVKSLQLELLMVEWCDLNGGVVGREDVSEEVVSLLEDPLLAVGAEREGEWRTQFCCSLQLWGTPVNQPHHLQLRREREREEFRVRGRN